MFQAYNNVIVYIFVYICSFQILYIIDYYKILNTVPCTIQQALIIYFIYSGSSSIVLVAQSCLTLCDPMDGSPPGSSVHGILQARVLEWVATYTVTNQRQLKYSVHVQSNLGKVEHGVSQIDLGLRVILPVSEMFQRHRM